MEQARDRVAELLSAGPRVINLGVRELADSVASQGARVTDVDWRPPAAADKALLDLLDRLL